MKLLMEKTLRSYFEDILGHFDKDQDLLSCEMWTCCCAHSLLKFISESCKEIPCLEIHHSLLLAQQGLEHSPNLAIYCKVFLLTWVNFCFIDPWVRKTGSRITFSLEALDFFQRKLTQVKPRKIFFQLMSQHAEVFLLLASHRSFL